MLYHFALDNKRSANHSHRYFGSNNFLHKGVSMETPWIPEGYWEHFPHTVSVITTYKCNAACKDCCFECNPALSARLSLNEMVGFIDEAWAAFPGLKLVVFSGGECFLLGEDLFAAIWHAHRKGLLTRCVTNGYWGKRLTLARRTAMRLMDSGIDEINISTGLDHLRWVSLDAVINVATALAEQGVFCLITVEQDSEESAVYPTLRSDPRILDHVEDGRILLQVNSWMPFHEDSELRKTAVNRLANLCQGCDQKLENCVLTPHGHAAGCCGLTFEHIPEMKLDWRTGESLRDAYLAQARDLLKLWLKVEGPYRILAEMGGKELAGAMERLVHPCQACALLHQNETIRRRLESEYGRHTERVMRAFYAKAAMAVEGTKKECVDAT